MIQLGQPEAEFSNWFLISYFLIKKRSACFRLQGCRWHNADFHYENSGALFVSVSIWNTIPLMYGGDLRGAFGQGQIFFLKQCFESCQALGQSGRALGARRKKGIEERGWRMQWVNLADFTALPGVCSGLDYELGSLRLVHIVLSHKENWQIFFPLLFCKMKSIVYLLAQLLNIIASRSQEEIKFQDDIEENMPNQEQRQRFFIK